MSPQPQVPDIRTILDPLQVPDEVKADAWDAWHAAKDDSDFQRRFARLSIPTEAKASLWDLKFPSGDIFDQVAKDATVASRGDIFDQIAPGDIFDQIAPTPRTARPATLDVNMLQPVASHRPTAPVRYPSSTHDVGSSAAPQVRPTPEISVTGFEGYQAPDVAAVLEKKPEESKWSPLTVAKGVGRGVFGLTTWPVTMPAQVAEAVLAPNLTPAQRVGQVQEAVHPARTLVERATTESAQSPVGPEQTGPEVPVTGFEGYQAPPVTSATDIAGAVVPVLGPIVADLVRKLPEDPVGTIAEGITLLGGPKLLHSVAKRAKAIATEPGVEAPAVPFESREATMPAGEGEPVASREGPRATPVVTQRPPVPQVAAVTRILDPLKVPDEVKASTWDAFHEARDANDLKARFDRLDLPTETKADLWDLRFAPETTGEARFPGVNGRETTLLTPTTEIPARYRVVEANSLIPSHNAFTFTRNEGYPSGVQERAYHTSKEAQARVVEQAQNYQPDFTVNTNPDAVNGPPIVTPDGIVLGGNSRTMSTQRIYGTGQGEPYRAYLARHAEEFGVKREDIAAMKNPILVREIPAPATLDEARRVASELNKSMTGALGVSERAVSAGKSISLESLNQITAMKDELGEGATLRDLMRQRGHDLIPMLVRDRLITEQERPQFVDTATGGLSEEGKNFVERALLGSVVDDPVLMDRTPKSALNKIEGSLADLASLAGREDEYNILPVLRQALAEHAEIAQRGTSTELYLRQSRMFGETRNAAVDALVRLLDQKPKAVKAAIRQFVSDARFDVAGQQTLGLMERPSAAQAFNEAFRTNLSDHELTDAVKNAAGMEDLYGSRTSEKARGVEARTEGLQPTPTREARPGSAPRIGTPEEGAVQPKVSERTGEDFTREGYVRAPSLTERLVAEEAGFAEPGALMRPAGLIATEAEKVRESRALHEGLDDLKSQNEADQIRALQKLKQAPGTAKDWEAVYHYQENPREPLTGEQRELLNFITPINEESTRIYTKLTEGGMPVENYVHRVVRDKGGFLDRVMESFGQKAGVGSRNVLSKWASAAKGRTMLALNDEAGNREIVAIKGGRVTSFRGGENVRAIDLGPFREGLTTEGGVIEDKTAPINRRIRALEKERNLLKATPSRTEVTFQRRKNISIEIDKLERQRDALLASTLPEDLRNRVWLDRNGHKWKIGQATTKEIEANTNLRYYHNALASSLTNYLELRRAERAYDFLETFKNDPHFSEVAMPRGQGQPPKGWRTVQLDQFRNYYFRPHEAEVLDWFAKRMRHDPAGTYEKIGNFLRTSIFFNPLIHIPNISIHWIVEKGIRGWLPDRWGTSWRASLRAIDAVTHQNKDFLEALDSGAPLQSQRQTLRDFNKVLFAKMAGELEMNPTTAQRVAKALGYADPLKLIKAVYDFSGKATWVSNDIAFLQATYEKTARGMSLKDALTETGKHIPNYRLPARIFDSPTLAKLMSNPNLSMFGAYHYGALRSYGEMLKSVLSKSSSAAERAHGLDLLATVGLVTFVVYPQVDKLLKAITGNKDAELRRAGAATFPYNLYLLAKGEKSLTEVAESVSTPAVHTKAGVELATNRDLRTGRRIYDIHAEPRTMAWQVAHRLLGYVAPLGSAERATEGESQRTRTALGFLGVQFRKHGAEKIARDISYQHLNQEAPTPESQTKANLVRTLRDAADQGDLSPARVALRNRQINAKQYEALVRTSRGQDLVDLTRNFNYDEIKQVYDVATPQEKKLLESKLRRETAKERVKASRASGSTVPTFLRPFTRSAAAGKSAR
jgi:predicted 3-demethylubiquinone-9 3-methyltransferase (glyoxalase superfamily)